MFFFSQYWCRTFWVLILSYLPTVLNATRRVPEVFRSEVKFNFLLPSIKSFQFWSEVSILVLEGGGGGGGGGVPTTKRTWLATLVFSHAVSCPVVIQARDLFWRSRSNEDGTLGIQPLFRDEPTFSRLSTRAYPLTAAVFWAHENSGILNLQL